MSSSVRPHTNEAVSGVGYVAERSKSRKSQDSAEKVASVQERSTTNNSAYYPVKDGIKLYKHKGMISHNSAMSKFTSTHHAEGGSSSFTQQEQSGDSAAPGTADGASERRHFVPMNAVMQGSLHSTKKRHKHLFLRDFQANTTNVDKKISKEAPVKGFYQVSPRHVATDRLPQGAPGAKTTTATTRLHKDSFNVYL